MALGVANVFTENLGQGDFKTPENQFLFIGTSAKNNGKLQFLNPSSDLDDAVGVADSLLKTTLRSAMLNSDSEWTAVAIPIANKEDWETAFNKAISEKVVFEGVIICDEVTDKSVIDDFREALVALENSKGRRLFLSFPSRNIDSDNELWTEYIEAINGLNDNIVAIPVNPVALVRPTFLGEYAGRIARNTLSVADTPMRVATGAIVGDSELPVDKDGNRFDNAHAKALNDARFTVPQTYEDFDGIYCSDGMMLDSEAGDFQVIENLRIINKAARRLRILAIRKIGDRELNSTPASTAAHETYFMRPLIDMSKSTTIRDRVIPGDIHSPEDGDIEINWVTRTEVKIYMQARPYNCPKKIRIAISLDLSNNAL